MLLTDLSFESTVVENALREILSSQYFRSSAQCSSLLRYMVQNTLADRDDCLRERVIGCEVFDRAPDYDTGNDHIVRSRASEVRKRLAQYYQGAGTSTIRISIPSGSYRATFDLVSHPPSVPALVPADSEPVHTSNFRLADPEELGAAVDAPVPEVPITPVPASNMPALEVRQDPRAFVGAPPTLVHRSRSFVSSRTFVALAALLLLAIATALSAKMWFTPGTTAFDRFWAPLNQSPKPALIYCGGGFVYKLSDQFLDAYRLKHGLKETRREFFVDLKPGDAVPGPDLIQDRHFVPFGDLASTVRVVAALSNFKKAYDLRYGDDLAFTEFRTSPVILIGGLNNSWALKVTHNLRYVLDQDDRIVDQWHREKVWTQTADPENQAWDDYAIISRLNASGNGTGGFVLSIAGIRMYGTRAAAELISDPAKLDPLLKTLPKGWETKNLQIVLHTRTMNEIPVSVNVEAIHSW